MDNKNIFNKDDILNLGVEKGYFTTDGPIGPINYQPKYEYDLEILKNMFKVYLDIKTQYLHLTDETNLNPTNDENLTNKKGE